MLYLFISIHIYVYQFIYRLLNYISRIFLILSYVTLQDPLLGFWASIPALFLRPFDPMYVTEDVVNLLGVGVSFLLGKISDKLVNFGVKMRSEATYSLSPAELKTVLMSTLSWNIISVCEEFRYGPKPERPPICCVLHVILKTNVSQS